MGYGLDAGTGILLVTHHHGNTTAVTFIWAGLWWRVNVLKGSEKGWELAGRGPAAWVETRVY